MKWWIKAEPAEIAQVIASGIKPQDFAARLRGWGFAGLWFKAFNRGRGLWSRGWCDLPADIGPYLEELRSQELGVSAAVSCFHDPEMWRDDESSRPILITGLPAPNGEYRAICPTHSGYLAVLAGRVEAVILAIKPDQIILDHLHTPLNWESENEQHDYPLGCVCPRCIATTQRGDVGLCVCDGIEESVDLPKYQCKRLKKKKISDDKILAAWMLWRSAHNTQIAKDLKLLMPDCRGIVSLPPPLKPQRVLEESDIRAGQNIRTLNKERFTLSPMLYAEKLRKDDDWIVASIEALQEYTKHVLPDIEAPARGDRSTWMLEWEKNLTGLGVEEAAIASLGRWLGI